MLSDRDRAVLDFEIQWTRDAGTKHEMIREQLGMNTARYYLVLNRILDDPSALSASPVEVNRLRRLRAARVATREARRF